MALPHAKHLDVINVAPLGDQLHGTVSTSLIKTERIQLLHIVLGAHQEQPMHHVEDECTIHCLEGLVDVYRSRRDTMLAALSREMPPGVEWTHPAGGFYVWVRVPPSVDL